MSLVKHLVEWHKHHISGIIFNFQAQDNLAIIFTYQLEKQKHQDPTLVSICEYNKGPCVKKGHNFSKNGATLNVLEKEKNKSKDGKSIRENSNT